MDTSMYSLSIKKKCYVLYGLLLGDAVVYDNKLRIAVENTQRDYIRMLHKLFSKWKLKCSVSYDYIHHDKEYSQIVVYLTSPMKRHLKRMYEANKFKPYIDTKRVKSYVMRRISALGLMMWWLQKGFIDIRHYKSNDRERSSRVGKLMMCGFKKHDVEVASRWLSKRFDIDAKVRKLKVGYILTLTTKNIQKLIHIIYPYIHIIPESMVSKIDMKYTDENDKYAFSDKSEVTEKQNFYCLDLSKSKRGTHTWFSHP